MSDVPSIVKELRNEEKYESPNIKTESSPMNIQEKSEKDQKKLTTEDQLDAIWFDMWKFL